MKIKILSIFSHLILPFLLFHSFALSQEKDQLTVNWIYGPESRKVTALPSIHWTKDNLLILMDNSRPDSERTLEKLNPGSGKSRSIINRDRAIQSLRFLLGKEHAPAALPFPMEFDDPGEKAIYMFDHDIFLLNLENSQFERITHNQAEEKQVHFSPDNKLLAFIRDNDLYIYDIENKAEIRLTHDGSETLLNGTLSWVYWEEIFGRQEIGYWWSGDSKAIAFLQTDESPVSLMHYVDFKPYVPRIITQRYPKAGGNNPMVRVGIVEVNDQRTTWVNLSDTTIEYVVRVTWLPNNQQLSVQTLNRAQTVLDLYFVDRYSGQANHILQETDPAWVNIHDDLYFLKDGQHFVWASERTGYAHLYRYDMAGRLMNAITTGEWAIHASSGLYWLRQAVVAIDEKAQWIYFTALKKSSLERHLYRVHFDGTDLQQISDSDGVHIITFSPDAKYYVDRFSSIHNLPVLNLYRCDGKLLQTLGKSNVELISRFEIQSRELFTILTRDSFAMPASILKPKEFDPQKKYPLILNIYGGPSAPTVINSWNFSIYFDQILVDHGFLVASVDNRSATAISKILENTILMKAGGETELNDLLDAVRWFKSQPWIDPDRIGVWGWSGGGTFTLNAMTHATEFKAGIAVAAVTDWRYYDTKWAECAMKRPEDNLEGYEKTSLIQSAKNLHGRLLLVHGTYDDNVHIQNTWAFVDELINANKTFDMMIYPMRQHGISDSSARIHLYHTMLEFWLKNL